MENLNNILIDINELTKHTFTFGCTRTGMVTTNSIDKNKIKCNDIPTKVIIDNTNIKLYLSNLDYVCQK